MHPHDQEHRMLSIRIVDVFYEDKEYSICELDESGVASTQFIMSSRS